MAIPKKNIQIEESELLTLLKNKDKTGFDILYQNYSNAIYGIIIRMLKDENESNDLLQDVFVKIWTKIDTYDRKKGKLFTWMANLTRNLVIDRIRSADYKNHNLGNFVRDGNVRILDSKYHRNQSIDTIGIRGLVQKLKPELKELIVKIYFEGYTQADVAEDLGIPLGTLKTRVRAAMKALKENFD